MTEIEFLTIDVPFSGTGSTAAVEINNIGQIVGFYFDNNVTPSLPNGQVHGFIFTDGIFTSFDFPSAVSTLAQDSNDHGQIAGLFAAASSDSIARSFILDNGIFATFDVPFTGVVATQVGGINNQGQIVGRYIETNPDDVFNPYLSRSFIASPNVNSPLVDSIKKRGPLVLKEANSVSLVVTDEVQTVLPNGVAGRQECFHQDTTPARLRTALSNSFFGV